MKVQLVYKVIPHGRLAGVPALWLRPVEKQDESYKGFSEVLQDVIDGFATTNMHYRLLAIDVREREVDPQEIGNITQLLDWAMRNNVGIIHYINGRQWPSYARMGGVIKLYTDGVLDFPVASSGVSELYWYPQERDPQELAFEQSERVAKYLVPSAKFSVSDAYRFISHKCESAWAIAVPHTTELEIELYE